MHTYIYVYVEIQRTKKYGTKFTMIMMRICAYACVLLLWMPRKVYFRVKLKHTLTLQHNTITDGNSKLSTKKLMKEKHYISYTGASTHYLPCASVECCKRFRKFGPTTDLKT